MIPFGGRDFKLGGIELSGLVRPLRGYSGESVEIAISSRERHCDGEQFCSRKVRLVGVLGRR